MTKSLRNVIIFAVGLVIALAVVLTSTYSVLYASRTATGTVTFTENYKLSVAKTAGSEIQSSDITLEKNFFHGSATANVVLSATNTTARATRSR